MRNKGVRLIVISCVASGLAGCGLVVPNIKEAWDSDYPGAPASAATNNEPTPPVTGAAQIEFEIAVVCSLQKIPLLKQQLDRRLRVYNDPCCQVGQQINLGWRKLGV
jgi:hypothetical protein